MYQLDDDSNLFPPVSEAMREPNGLLAIGGDLSSKRLQAAYYDGIFPWFNPGEMPLWWSPDPRAVLMVGDLHISRSMKKVLKKQIYRITINTAFKQVIEACSVRPEGTWILPEVQAGYLALHQEGIAHSVEAWHGSQLVGGLYGVNMGHLFCGESMFSRMNDASKFAFITFFYSFLLSLVFLNNLLLLYILRASLYCVQNIQPILFLHKINVNKAQIWGSN